MKPLWTLLAFIVIQFPNHILSEKVDNHVNNDSQSPIFHTKSGPVRGTTIRTDDQKTVNVLFGIPYSEPPVGRLRFKPPEKVQPWTSVLEVNKPKPPCYQQLPTTGAFLDALRVAMLRPWYEDCLHLNIWAPATQVEKHPVIFFIHGGGFILGSGTRNIDGTAMASDGFVVVTMNYRLSVFGFFSLGNDEAPGNLGLMDQNLALQWVNDNAEVFGGDRVSITLVGMSAGSASVGFHLLSPKSSSLFKRALLMSGVPTNWWSMKDPQFTMRKSQKMIKVLGCQSENLTTALLCLQERHPEDILDICRSTTMSENENDFGPVVDGTFVTEHPSVSVESGRFNKADVMLGTAIDEGAMFMLMRNEDILKTKDGRIFRRDFSKVISRMQPGLSKLQTRTIENLYSNASSPNDPIMLRDAAKNAYSDSWFNCRVDEFADKLSETGYSVYRYVFDYKLNDFLMWNPQWAGAVHGQDQRPLLTPVSFLKQAGFSEKAHEDCRKFRKHIENFARNGDPNLELDEYPNEPVWPKYDRRKLALNFDSTSTILPVQRQRQCAAWINLFPLLDKASCQNVD